MKSFNLLALVGLFLLSVFLLNRPVGSAEQEKAFRIVAYLPEYRMNRFDAGHAAMLTDLILFAAEPSPSGEVQMGRLANSPWEDLWAFRDQANVRLILCLGGWEKSTSFSECVARPESRRRLVKHVVEVLRDRKLDGLDIDWEYPQGKEDWEGYQQLLTQLRDAFRPHNWTLSMTVAPWREIPEQAWKTVDFVQLMSYDYGQQHSTLQQATSDMQTFLDRGIPAEKIVLGMPFYGRNIADRKATTYSRIADLHNPGPETDEVSGIFFNGRKTIQSKTSAALQAGIGGVMIWEIGQDTQDERSLLKAISETVKRQAPVPFRRER